MSVTEAEQLVWAEFGEVLNDAAGAHIVARNGTRLIAEQVAHQLSESIDKEQERVYGVPASASDGYVTAYQAWPLASYSERLAPDGPVARLLSQQWAVYVYAEWEDHYRKRIADARGVEKDDVKDDVLGDLRLIRHDIVHSRGVATANQSGRCKVLKWFSDGDLISISPTHVSEFMGHLGLHRTPAPQRSIRDILQARVDADGSTR